MSHVVETTQVADINSKQILKEVFGYDEFRPLQQTIVEKAIQGEDNFVLMPTGGGKSLCFQIPAIARPGIGIVVSPLISLMQDQVNALQANGVRAEYYNSSLSSDDARRVLAKLHNQELDLLYVAPERLMMPSFIARLEELDLAIFAIDEAHCVSQWGHDFRPEYVQLGQLRTHFPDVPVMALTATADNQTRADILQRLHLQKANQHVASFDRPNIRYTVIEKHKPLKQVIDYLHRHDNQVGIIYCTTRKRVDELSAQLQKEGFKALPYHAGLSSKVRSQAQDAFARDDVQLIVATVAFGMGIDKPNVRFIIHYDISKNIECYYQETGRAGRDGLPAEALTLFGGGDIAKIRGLIETTDNPDQRRIEIHKLNCMVAFAEAQHCRRRVLLNYFSENMDADCGNCDVCLNPPETYDATQDAQKALSCVYRVRQRFGVSHVVEVLRGSDTQRIRQLGHDQLSTYGIGREQSQQAWLSIFRQLIHRGYITQDIANYSILQLTEKARPLLRGEAELILAKPRIKLESSKKKKTSRKQITQDYDKTLFELLRTIRKEIADRDGVPPFVVFSDASLAQMSAELPKDEEAFLGISGVGQRKLDIYGDIFIGAIKDYGDSV